VGKETLVKAIWAAALFLLPAQDSVEDLILRLGADEIEERDRAVDLLLERGPAALPALKKAATELKDPEILVRIGVLRKKILKRSAVMWHPVGERWGESVFKRDVAFSPDGTLLVSAYGDDRIRIWDPRTGKLKRLLPTQDLNHRLSFSDDGRFLHVFDYDTKNSSAACEALTIWDLEKSRRVATVYKGFQFALAPSGKTAARAFLGELFLVSLPEGRERPVYRDGKWPRSMVFSPDSKLFFIQEKNRIRVVDVETAREADAFEVGFELDALGQLWMTKGGKMLLATNYREKGMGSIPRFRGEDRVAFIDLEKRASEQGLMPYRTCERMDFLADPASVPFEHERFEATDGYGRRAAFLRHRESGAIDAFINMTWSDDGKTAATIAPDGTIAVYENGEQRWCPGWKIAPRDVTWILQHIRSEDAKSYVLVRVTVGDFLRSEPRGIWSREVRYRVTLRRTFRIDARLHNPEGLKVREIAHEYTRSAPTEEEARKLEPPYARGDRLLMLLELLPGQAKGFRTLLTLPHTGTLEAALRN
jgi:hypothetical protein